MIHGGDLLTYKDRYDGELIDFSSNINPLGLPQGLDKKLISAFNRLEAYPDIKYRKLKKSIAKYLRCKEENIVVGNGAVEIIDNFIIDSKRVILVTPSFAEYELRARVHGKEIVKVNYKSDFTIDINSLEEVIEKGDLLILGNPNNPSGLRIEKEKLVRIYELICKKQAYLLLDEAFYEFCPYDYDSIELFKNRDYENVGIIRAATKFFALPGIRLGYGCGDVNKLDKINKISLPWSVNALADIAGQYIFDDLEYIKKSKEYIEGERQFLLKELGQIRGLKVYQSHSNFILMKLEKYEEDYVFDFFLKRGIVIRKCSSFEELGKNHIRVAVKDNKSNKKLLKIFKELEKYNLI